MTDQHPLEGTNTLISVANTLVPMPPFLRGGVVAGEPFHSTHTAGVRV